MRVGLDEQRLRSCVATRRYEGRVRSQVAEGNSKRIEATPTIFANGKRRVGALAVGQLKQLMQNAGGDQVIAGRVASVVVTLSRCRRRRHLTIVAGRRGKRSGKLVLLRVFLFSQFVICVL